VAALIGLALLGQHLSVSEWAAVGCVVVACVGAARSAPLAPAPSPDLPGPAAAPSAPDLPGPAPAPVSSELSTPDARSHFRPRPRAAGR